MKRLILPTALLLFFMTALSAIETPKSVIGDWVFDVEKTIKGFEDSPMFKQIPAEQKEFALKSIAASLKTAKVKIEAGKVIIDTGAKKDESTFTVIKIEGKVISVKIKDKDPLTGKDKESAGTMEVTDAKNIKLNKPGEPSIFLKKK
jgi:hypothetical protein